MPQSIVITYKKALKNKPLFDEILTSVSKETGAQSISNLKNPLTTLKKVVEKAAEDPKRDYTLEDVNDIVRGRLVYGTRSELKKGIEEFEEKVKESGLKVGKEQDFFANPEDGYQGYHVDIEFPNGQKAEVQFHTIQSYAAAMLTHDDHEEYGDLKPDEVRERDEGMNEKVLSMNKKQAGEIARAVERKNAPIMQKTQEAAMRVAKGQDV